VYGPGAKTDGLFDLLFKLTAKHSLVTRLNWPGRTSVVHVDDVSAIMIGLAQRKEAANEIYCVANPDAPSVGALAAQIAQLSPGPASPVNLPPWAWALSRSLAWNRAVQRLGATVNQTTFWRLTLMVDDGFWFDTRKLQTVWTQPTRTLADGLAEMRKYL
jgi:nucleoside-diphosphate-sugar epimerase